jgi:hypothetical protein
LGGYLSNSLSGYIGSGGILFEGAAGTVVNDGKIVDTATGFKGVALYTGGTVTNSGTISATGSGATGVYIYGGGGVDNTSSGLIDGGLYGVKIAGGTGTVTNSGTIDPAGPTSIGVYLEQGGYDFNAGFIDGPLVGIRASAGPGRITVVGTVAGTGTAGVGIDLMAGGTVVTSGTISGSSGTAISFGGTGNNLLVVDPGAVFSGSVFFSPSATNTVHLFGSAGPRLKWDFDDIVAPPPSLDVLFGPGGNSTLLVSNSTGTLPATISGFTLPGDIIDLTGLPIGTLANGGTVNGSDQLVVGNESQSVVLQLDTSQNYTGIVFQTGTDGTGGTDVNVACFCRGTLIWTERGEVAVEDLAIGDEVVILSGEARPIKWIGHRAYDGRFVTGNRAVLPIRIEAGALDEGVPTRDLLVSPEHALYIDGVLVPAGLLVNGATIRQVERIDRLEYFHIELDSHEVILAEGAPAESFVDCDNRGMFQNGAEFAALYPDDRAAPWEFCAPRLDEASDALPAIRAALLERAGAQGDRLADDADLHLIIDGEIVRAQAIDEAVYRFTVPAGSGAVWLASRSAVPAEAEPASQDRRRLGVALERIVLTEADLRTEIGYGHALLREGFHDSESGYRWTDGMARVPGELLCPFVDDVTVELHLVRPSLRYPLAAPAPEASPAPLRAPSACPAA